MFRSAARVAFVWATCAVLFLVTACGTDQTPDSPNPRVSFQTDSARPHFGAAIATPVDSRALDLDSASWATVFVVHAGDTTGLPMLGRYTVANDTLWLDPAYPPVRGTTYMARFDGGALNRALHLSAVAPTYGSNALWTREFPSGEPTTFVESVYPTIDSVPMNLLRMYIQFSAPMTVGDEAERHIRLLDEQGKTVDNAFLVAAGGQELWDPAHTRMTIFFDPGRIKRDLKPHEALGLPLRTGHTYSLVIDSTLHDSRGLVLARGYAKRFKVGPIDRAMPTTNLWRVASPNAGTRDSLIVDLPESLDHALLSRMLKVLDGKSNPVAGTSAPSRHDRRWAFAPAAPWQPGSYFIEVDTELEDLAGNNLRHPFDVMPGDSSTRGADRPSVRLSFTIK